MRGYSKDTVDFLVRRIHHSLRSFALRFGIFAADFGDRMPLLHNVYKKVVILQPFPEFLLLFVSEKNENVWWYDGERIAFRTPNYTKILNAMQTQPMLTLADMKEVTGISIAAIQKLLDQLVSKKYVERGEREGSWRVFLTQ